MYDYEYFYTIGDLVSYVNAKNISKDCILNVIYRPDKASSYVLIYLNN